MRRLIRSLILADTAARPMGGTSSYGNLDLATTVAFADDPLQAGTTTIRALHLDEARAAVNAVRAAAGLLPFSFTDSALLGLPVKAIHVQELRSALDPARAAIGVPGLPYANTLTAGTTIVRLIDLTELQEGVK